MKSTRFATVLFLALVLVGCAPRGLAPSTGTVEVQGGKVWYRIVGSGSRTPVIVLHGGPGVPSYYLKPLAFPRIVLLSSTTGSAAGTRRHLTTLRCGLSTALCRSW